MGGREAGGDADPDADADADADDEGEGAGFVATLGRSPWETHAISRMTRLVASNADFAFISRS